MAGAAGFVFLAVFVFLTFTFFLRAGAARFAFFAFFAFVFFFRFFAMIPLPMAASSRTPSPGAHVAAMAASRSGSRSAIVLRSGSG
ncbi:MAG TPA: hypothetical protein VMI47_06425, partial [Pseudolabrys sp.]|nr:hypothetical protein [Pseudolabrys sp.]